MGLSARMRLFACLWLLATGPAWAGGAAAETPPQAPSALTGYFSFETLSRGQEKPVVHLGWRAAEPTMFLLGGYRIYRGEGQGVTPTVLGPADKLPASDLGFDDRSVELGKVYRYRVQAFDAKGNTSAPSNQVAVDLAHLPSSQLAPAAPAGLTARGGQFDVLLDWQPSDVRVDPVSYYQVFRAPSVTGLLSETSTALKSLTATSLADLVPDTHTAYFYRVRSVDSKARASDFSATVSAKATGTLPPTEPGMFTARAEEGAVLLSWEPSSPGTSPVSEYYIRRRPLADPGAAWDLIGPRPVSFSAYTDYVSAGLDDKRVLLYQVFAVDHAGNSSDAAELSALPLPKPVDKTGLLLMPTAFSNHKNRDTGLNLNGMFSYYIGSLYETFDAPSLGRTRTGVFQPIRIGTATAILKYSFFPNTEFTPTLGVGMYTVALLSLSQPTNGSSQSVGASSSGNSSFTTLGGPFIVASKWLWRGAAIHAGLMRGDFANDLVRLFPPNWALTLRHISPGGNFTDLFPKLVDPGLNVPVETAPNLLFYGLQFPFTVPLGFFNWRTGLRMEYLTPAFPDTSVNSAEIPYMINAHIDNLPLFGFEFSYFHYFQGYEIVAFYHFRDLNW